MGSRYLRYDWHLRKNDPGRARFSADRIPVRAAVVTPVTSRQSANDAEKGRHGPWSTIWTTNDGQFRVEQCPGFDRLAVDRLLDGRWTTIVFVEGDANAVKAARRMAGEIDDYMEPAQWRLLYAGNSQGALLSAAAE